MRKKKVSLAWGALGSFLISWIVVLPARAESITLPSATELHVVLETGLTTKGSKVGDPFRARLVMPVFVNQSEALPIGAVVEGKVASLKGPGRVKGKAQMQLRPETITLPDGRSFSLAASITGAQTGDEIDVDPKEGTVSRSDKEGMDARKTASGAAMGAGIGAMTAGGTGALVGAGAVGAVMLLRQVLKRGKDADLPAGSEIILELSRPVSIPRMEEVSPPPKPALRRSSSSGSVSP